jgi:chitinase
MVKNFFNSSSRPLEAKASAKIDCYHTDENIKFCKYIQSLCFNAKVLDRTTGNDMTKDAINWGGSVFPSHDNAWGNEVDLLDSEVSNLKEGFWGVSDARNADTLDTYTGDGTKAFKHLKDTIAAIRYYMDPTINAWLIVQKDRVGNTVNQLEMIYLCL